MATSGSGTCLLHGSVQGCPGHWGKGDWGASPARFHGNGSPVMSKESCCHRQRSRNGTARLSQGAVGYSSRGWATSGHQQGEGWSRVTITGAGCCGGAAWHTPGWEQVCAAVPPRRLPEGWLRHGPWGMLHVPPEVKLAFPH